MTKMHIYSKSFKDNLNFFLPQCAKTSPFSLSPSPPLYRYSLSHILTMALFYSQENYSPESFREPTPKRGGWVLRASMNPIVPSAVSTVSLSELMPPPLGPKLITAVFLLLSAKRSNSSLKSIDGHRVCYFCHWVHKAYTNSLVSLNVPFFFSLLFHSFRLSLLSSFTHLLP